MNFLIREFFQLEPINPELGGKTYMAIKTDNIREHTKDNNGSKGTSFCDKNFSKNT